MRFNDSNLVRLNPTDFVFFASEDAFPSVGIVVSLRFKSKISIDEIRSAMRYMLSVYPRLRSIVVSKLFSYKIKILDDDNPEVEQLFNDAFRVVRNVKPDSEAYFTSRRDLLNESFRLLDTFPVKICYFPDDPNPMLLISIHHMNCDGLSFHHLINSLMLYLNGKTPPLIPLEDSSLWSAIAKKPSYKLPGQLYQNFKQVKKEITLAKDLSVCHATHTPSPSFGKVNVFQHALSVDLNLVKIKSKDLGYSLTVLLFTALTLTLTKIGDKKSGNTIGLNHALNIRPFFDGKQPVFGNYAVVDIIAIHEKFWNDTKKLMEEIHRQLSRNINRLRNKQMLYNHMFNSIMTRCIGKNKFVKFIKNNKKNNHRLIPGTCFASTGGNLDKFNSYGTKAQISEFIDMTAINHLFIAITSLEGKINVNSTYPESEFTRKEISNMFISFEEELDGLLSL